MAAPGINPVLTQEDIIAMRKCVDRIYLDEKIENYVLDIVLKTREPRRISPAAHHPVRRST